MRSASTFWRSVGLRSGPGAAGVRPTGINAPDFSVVALRIPDVGVSPESTIVLPSEAHPANSAKSTIATEHTVASYRLGSFLRGIFFVAILSYRCCNEGNGPSEFLFSCFDHRLKLRRLAKPSAEFALKKRQTHG